jgi:hypothetical protein
LSDITLATPLSLLMIYAISAFIDGF